MEYQYFVKDITKEIIPPLLLELSYMYYEQLDEKSNERKKEAKVAFSDAKSHYQCEECLTIYDEELGDAEQGIPAGTSFKALPDNYSCPTCAASKKKFKPSP